MPFGSPLHTPSGPQSASELQFRPAYSEPSCFQSVSQPMRLSASATITDRPKYNLRYCIERTNFRCVDVSLASYAACCLARGYQALEKSPPSQRYVYRVRQLLRKVSLKGPQIFWTHSAIHCYGRTVVRSTLPSHSGRSGTPPRPHTGITARRGEQTR